MKVLMEAAKPCTMGAKKRLLWETASESDDESNNIQKTKHACIVEDYESTRKRLETTPPEDHEDHEDHITKNGYCSISHYNLDHTIILMPQEMKIPDAKAAVDK